MIFYLGLLDAITGLVSMVSYNYDVFRQFTAILLSLLLLKGLWSTFTGRTCLPIFVLGLLDLVTGAIGLLFLNYGIAYSIAYLFAFIILIKGAWTVFSTLFS